ncbi:DOCK3 protein, partial [Polypterus senegalus]
MWTPTEEEKIGVVICNFRGSVPQGLILEIGETVQILEKCEGWYRGFSARKPAIKGIFPASYVHLKKAIVSNRGQYETVTPLEDPIVTEVTSTLQEWAVLWKQLYVNQLSAAGNRAAMWRMSTGAVLIPTTFTITSPTSSCLKSFLRQIEDLSASVSEKLRKAY